MHRADRLTSPHRGHRHHPPGGAPASMLLQPLDPGPADLTPYRARVTIREIPQRPQRPPRRPGIWIGGYRVRAIDVITFILVAAAVLAYLYWPHSPH